MGTPQVQVCLSRDVIQSKGRRSALFSHHLTVGLFSSSVLHTPYDTNDSGTKSSTDFAHAPRLALATTGQPQKTLGYFHRVLRADPSFHQVRSDFSSGDECAVRELIGSLLGQRDTIRRSLAAKRMWTLPWLASTLNHDSPDHNRTLWVWSPAANLVTNLYAVRDENQSSSESVAFIHDLDMPRDIVLRSGSQRWFYRQPCLRNHTDSNLGDKPSRWEYWCSSDGVSVELAVREFWYIGASRRMPNLKLKRKIGTQTQESKKRRREVQRDSGNLMQDDSKERTSRHVQWRLNRARDRELDRWGRLLRRAAELDVTRCCNDVRTLLYARWQCEEANLLIGNPPSLDGDCDSATSELSLCKHADRSTCQAAECNIWDSARLNPEIDDVVLELSDLLCVLGPTSDLNLPCIPTAVELSSAVESAEDFGKSWKRHNYAFSSPNLLHRVAQVLVRLVMPRWFRLPVIGDRSQSSAVSAAFPEVLNELTWPCFARLALLTCAYREVGLSEAEIHSELRGGASWARSPLESSTDFDTKALLMSRARYFARADLACDASCFRRSEMSRVLVKRPGLEIGSKDECCQPGTIALDRQDGMGWHPVLSKTIELTQIPVKDAVCHERTCKQTQQDKDFRPRFVLERTRVAVTSQLRDGETTKVNSTKSRELLEALLYDSDASYLKRMTHYGVDGDHSTFISTLWDLRTRLCRGQLEESLWSFVETVRDFLRHAATCGFETSDCHGITGRLLAKFEAMVRRKQNPGLYNRGKCSSCQGIVGSGGSFLRCRRCDAVSHLRCLEGEKDNSMTHESSQQIWFCISCLKYKVGPGPADGWIGCTLRRTDDLCFQASGSTNGAREALIVDQVQLELTGNVVLCKLTSVDGSSIDVEVPPECVSRENEYANAGWGLPAAVLPDKLNPKYSIAATRQSKSSCFVDLLDATKSLTCSTMRKSNCWSSIFRGLLHAISCSNELGNLLLQINEEVSYMRRTSHTPATALLRLRPRIMVLKTEPSLPLEKLPLAHSSPPTVSKDPQYAHLHCASEQNAPLHKISILTGKRGHQEGLRDCDMEIESREADAKISCTVQDRRKFKEARMVTRVAQAAATGISFESTEMSHVAEDHLRSLLVSAAMKGIQATSEKRNVSETPIKDGFYGSHATRQCLDATRPCYLCGGDFEYLYSSLRRVMSPTESLKPKSMDEGSPMDPCGSFQTTRWAHEFCVETMSNFQAAIANRGKSRSLHNQFMSTPSWARTIPLGSDSQGQIYWYTTSSLNALWVQRTHKSGKPSVPSVRYYDNVPAQSQFMRSAAGKGLPARIATTLEGIFPEAQAISQTSKESSRSESHAGGSDEHVFVSLEQNIHDTDFHMGDASKSGVNPLRSKPRYRDGGLILVRGCGVLWRARLSRSKMDVIDSSRVYLVRTEKWSNMHDHWLYAEQIIVPTRAVFNCQQALYQRATSSWISALPGWILLANLRATSFITAPRRYSDGLAATAMCSVFRVRGIDAEFERVRAMLVTIEVALPEGSKHNWSPEKTRKRIYRIACSVHTVELVELMLLNEDEVKLSWLAPHWQSTRAILPNRQHLLRHPSVNWVALLAWNMDCAVEYEKARPDSDS